MTRGEGKPRFLTHPPVVVVVYMCSKQKKVGTHVVSRVVSQGVSQILSQVVSQVVVQVVS